MFKLAKKMVVTLASIWVVASCIVPIAGVNESPVLAAQSSKQVAMGQDYSFSVAKALGSQNMATFGRDCSAISYNFVINSPQGEEVFSRADAFVTEQCISRASDWKDILIWERTECQSGFDSCTVFEDGYFAKPGTYTVIFSLDIGLDSQTLTNTFTFQVLPAYLYRVYVDEEKIYPYKDKYLDYITGQIVFWNENGESVDVNGVKIGIKSGSKILAETQAKLSGNFSLAPGQTTTGSFEVDTTYLPKAAGGRSWVKLSGNTDVKLYPTKVIDSTLSVTAEVFPQKDSYLDVAYIGYKATTNSGANVPAKGTISIKRGNAIVKTFKVTKSGLSQFTWDGRDGGQIISGYYTVEAKVAGPQGGIKTSKKAIKVVNKKWVTKTLSATYDAYVAADESQGDSYDPIDRDGSSGARFYSSGFGDVMAVKLSVPINSAAVKWRITFNDWSTGDGAFFYYPCRNSDCISSYVSSGAKAFANDSSGYSTLTKWAWIPGTKANFLISSLDWASMYVDSFTVEYVIRKLE